MEGKEITKFTDEQLDRLTNDLKSVNSSIAIQQRDKMFFDRMGVEYEKKYRSNYWDGVLKGIEYSNKQSATLQAELEKAKELISKKEKAITDLSNCLEGSTQFLDRLIKDGAVDEESLIFAFIKTQIESNRMTLKEYNQKPS